MTAELFALLSTTVSIALQVKNTVEQIRYNQETHQRLVNRITNSLAQLQSESRKISRPSPGLINAVKKLQSKLQQILNRCQKPKNRGNALGAKFAEWFYKDSIASALQDIETQISFCFQEFSALGTIRIERKLGDHNIQVNRKLDELLRRTPATRPVRRTSVEGKDRGVKIPLPIPLQARTASGSSTGSEYTPEPPGLLNGRVKRGPTISLPSPVRSESRISSSTASIPDPKTIRRSYSPPVTVLMTKAPQDTPIFTHRHARSSGFLPSMKSDTSAFSLPLSTNRELSSSESLCELQANKLDSECKRLRSLKRPSEGLIPGRKAVALRRRVYSSNRNVTTAATLARSLTYLARCLKDIHVDSQLTRTKVSVELTAVLSESVQLYKAAFEEDKACRIDLATALYSLSVRLSEPVSQKPMSSSLPSLTTHISFHEIQRSKNLAAALTAAEEAVHHFSVLEREEADGFGMDLANALLNLSFILSDTGDHENALVISRKAVMLSYRLPLPHTQERVRNIRTLHKALMRVSYCLESLGRVEEAQEAESEANDVLKKPFYTSGS